MSEQENTEQTPVRRIMAGRDNNPDLRKKKIEDLKTAIKIAKKEKYQEDNPRK